MNELERDESNAAEGLSFEQAEIEDHSDEIFCNSCQRTLHDVYYMVDDGPSCEACRRDLELAPEQGGGLGRFVRALAFGSLAAMVGAGLYYAVLAITGYEIGLIAIVVGLMVGFGVKIGSRHRGGKVYQILAVALTYAAIVSTYVPMLVQEFANEYPVEDIEQEAAAESEALPSEASDSEATDPEAGPGEATEDGVYTIGEAGLSESSELEEITLAEAVIALLMFAGLVAAIPFLAGTENLIGLLIIGFALFEAWKVNRVHVPVVEGPFQIGAAPPMEDETDALS